MKTNLSGVQFTFPNHSVIHVPNGCYMVVPHPNGWICKRSPHPSRFACHLLRWRRLGERGSGGRTRAELARRRPYRGYSSSCRGRPLSKLNISTPRATVEQAQHLDAPGDR